LLHEGIETDRQTDTSKVRRSFSIGIDILTAIWLTPSGSSTVHIYTKSIHRTTQWNSLHITEHTVTIRIHNLHN